MNTINFDTLKAAKSLQDAGFEARQAEAMVVMVTCALSEGLATKDDVRELKVDLAVLDSKLAALDSKVEALDSKIDNGLAALDSKIDSGLAALDSKVAALDVKIDSGLNNVTQKLTIRLGGIVIGAITLLGVLNRIFPVVPAP